MPANRPFLLALGSAILCAGCPTGDAEPAADSHAWFEGTVVATKPDGEALGDPSVSLLRRSTLPGAERIEEQIVELDDGGVGLEVLASWTVVADDGTLRTQYQDAFGVLEGVGSLLDGEDWAWTAWESQVEYTTGELVGTTRQSEGVLAGGTLRIETEVIGADSELEVIEVRELESISESAFDASYAAVLGG